MEQSMSENNVLHVSLGKALVCLNIGADTFIDTLKENGVQFEFRKIRKEIPLESIMLKPNEYSFFLKTTQNIKNEKVLNKVQVERNEVQNIITVTPFSIGDWLPTRLSLIRKKGYSDAILPQLRLVEFAASLKMDSTILLQKLKSLGYQYYYLQWNIGQKIPLEMFLRYLSIKNLPKENFIECISVNNDRSEVITQQFSNDEKSMPDIEEDFSIPYTQKTYFMPIQKILFGSPGTGKSHTIDGAENSYLQQLGIQNKSLNCIKTVFHPEYTYGDFMGKLMPYTNDDGQVEYRFYAGHFLKALGKAYKNIILSKIEWEKERDEVERSYKREINKNNKKDFTETETEELQKRRDAVQTYRPQNVALIIDEINRGNSSAIFGTTFQLLDRDITGWSSYHVRISDLENNELLKEISLEYKEYKKSGRIDEVSYYFDRVKCSESDYNKYLDFVFEDLPENERINLTDRNIRIPPNLSIIATMNTSDNSIYFMDSAFKRRWDWEFIDVTSDNQKKMQMGRCLEDGYSWDDFVDNLNEFIKKYGERIRKIEDKQIGYYFIKGKIITDEAIKNKLMFFLWDSIFSNDKKPINDLIGIDKQLVTFGDFIRHFKEFVEAIKNKSFSTNVR